jgi:nucleoside-diphosphate-sugar epimerase
MRVFVAGASGAIGRPAVRQLVAAGHEVTGMTRREERMEEIRAAGATPVRCNVFSPEEVEKALRQAEPEVVVHLLTALPPRIDYRAKEDPLAATNRVRLEGTRNLIAAARAAGARRIVAESVAFLYVPEGGSVKDEEAPAFPPAEGPFGDAGKALADLERQVAEAEGIDGIVLRYGWLYGPGTYNVVDDEPAPMREWVPVFCEAVGAKKPMRVPVWLARLIAGAAAVGSATQLRGASNAKAKRELGWQPSYPSWRQGFADPAVRG